MYEQIMAVANIDPSSASATVDYLAQRAGTGTGESGIGVVDRAVNTIIRVIGAVIGIGFFWNAALDGWGRDKGAGTQQGMSSLKKILVGVGIMVVFQFIPNLINTGEGLVSSFI